jgi:hypothetical protein
MGTNGHEVIERVSLWMGPAISRVVCRLQADTLACMIEHRVGRDEVYELCKTKTGHGVVASQFEEPIRMLRQAAVNMEQLVHAAQEHLRALAPVYRHQGRGALPKSILDDMNNLEVAWACFIEWHHFLCAVQLGVVWNQGIPGPLDLHTGGQAPWLYFQDHYSGNAAFDGCRTPSGPRVDRLHAQWLWEWLYGLWEADNIET